jgi:Ca2+-binding RTX toxin-like protein
MRFNLDQTQGSTTEPSAAADSEFTKNIDDVAEYVVGWYHNYSAQGSGSAIGLINDSQQAKPSSSLEQDSNIRDDDDVDIPDTILWDLAGGNGVTATAPGDDDDDLPDIIIWDIAGGNVASEPTEGGLPDIMVRDDDDDSAPSDDDDDLPDIIIWDIDGGSVAGARSTDDTNHWAPEKLEEVVWPQTDDEEDVITGTQGADLLVGTDEDDHIYAGAGDDILSGMAGNDDLRGGTGSDTIFGGEGVDVLDGGNGNDVLDGGDGNDFLGGGAGDDILTGGAGNDCFQFIAASQSYGVGVDTIADYNLDEDRFAFSGSFLDIAPGETGFQNVIALQGDGGAELWADVKYQGLTQIAFVEDLTAAELQQELSEAIFIFG